MHFKALTTWQAEDYDITVVHGAFATSEEAASIAAGRTPAGVRTLRYADGELYLLFNDGQRLTLKDADIEVRKLKPVAISPGRPWTNDDFELVPVRIGDFAGIPELTRGFGSQGYGVRDPHGQVVPTLAFID